MAKNLNIQTAKGAINTILNLEYIDQCKALGINDSEWNDLTGPKPWSGKQRPIIKRLVDNLLFGMLDAMGLPRFAVPAEFVASVGLAFIYPTNYWAFSSWMGNFHRADELGNFDGSHNGPTDGLEKVTASQIFALILQLNSDESIELLFRRFQDKTELTLGYPMEEQQNEKKTAQK